MTDALASDVDYGGVTELQKEAIAYMYAMYGG
jgi:hypothetical protein